MTYELNHADLDRWITRTPEDYYGSDEMRDIEAEAREQGESDYRAECWKAGICAECGGDGRFYNMFGTGDQAGGLADTCDACEGSGKDLRGCLDCGTGHTIQDCPVIRARLMRATPPAFGVGEDYHHEGEV
jgi:hypothetical protein